MKTFIRNLAAKLLQATFTAALVFGAALLTGGPVYVAVFVGVAVGLWVMA